MIRAVYAGSFDPATFGHLDIIERGVKLFSEVIVGVGVNAAKKYTFTIDERIDILKRSLGPSIKIKILPFHGLLIDFAREHKCKVILRGLRVLTDFEYEFQIGLTNMNLDKDIETVFLLTTPKNIFISSSMVKEISQNGGDVSPYVHSYVKKRLEEKYKIIK